MVYNIFHFEIKKMCDYIACNSYCNFMIKIGKKAEILQIPYLIWCLFALYFMLN